MKKKMRMTVKMALGHPLVVESGMAHLQHVGWLIPLWLEPPRATSYRAVEDGLCTRLERFAWCGIPERNTDRVL